MNLHGQSGWLRFPIALVLILLGACTFEHRENGEEAEDPPAVVEPHEAPEDSLEVDPAQGALHTLRAFREAMAVGDLSLALALLDREASLLDDLVGDPELAGSRGEVLLELRARLAEGMQLEEVSTQVSFSGEAAVVITRLRLEVAEEAPQEWRDRDGSTLHETALLTPTEEGWRIRHLHRSILPLH